MVSYDLLLVDGPSRVKGIIDRINEKNPKYILLEEIAYLKRIVFKLGDEISSLRRCILKNRVKQLFNNVEAYSLEIEKATLEICNLNKEINEFKKLIIDLQKEISVKKNKKFKLIKERKVYDKEKTINEKIKESLYTCYFKYDKEKRIEKRLDVINIVKKQSKRATYINDINYLKRKVLWSVEETLMVEAFLIRNKVKALNFDSEEIRRNIKLSEKFIAKRENGIKILKVLIYEIEKVLGDKITDIDNEILNYVIEVQPYFEAVIGKGLVYMEHFHNRLSYEERVMGLGEKNSLEI